MASQRLQSNLRGIGKRKQVQLAKLLQDLKWQGSMDLIEGIYASNDPSVRWWAVAAAGQLSGARVRRFFDSAVRQDQDLGVRDLALSYLGLEGKEGALDMMIQILSNPSETASMRDRAADAIGDLFECHRKVKRRVEGINALIAALQDPSPEVRFTACFSLGKIEAHEAIGPLRQLSATDHEVAAHYGPVAKQATYSCDYLEGRSKTLLHVLNKLGEITDE